jgi:hypothetical protein
MMAAMRLIKLAGLLALSLPASLRVAAADLPLTIPPRNPYELTLMNPVQFLDWLKRPIEGIPGEFVSVHGPIKGWIRKEHIPALIGLLESREKCAAVVEVHSSFVPRGSTIGDEAALMIESYRGGHYPSRLSAGKVSQERRRELRDWWMAGGTPAFPQVISRE